MANGYLPHSEMRVFPHLSLSLPQPKSGTPSVSSMVSLTERASMSCLRKTIPDCSEHGK